MSWTNEIVSEFLYLYQDQPIIWDPKNPNHKDRNAVHDAWNRIREKLSISVTINELKKKKETLMGTFRKLHHKVKSSMKTGSGTEDVFKPDWFAYEQMAKFLHTVYTVRKTKTSEVQIDIIEDKHEMQENTINLSEDNSNFSLNDSNSKYLKSPSTRKATDVKKPKIDAAEKERRMDEAYNFLKSIQNKSGDDECSLFSELLCQKLRALDKNMRDNAMHEIDCLMFRYKQKQQFAFVQHSQTFTSQPSHSQPSHSPFHHRYSQPPSPSNSHSKLSQGFSPSPSESTVNYELSTYSHFQHSPIVPLPLQPDAQSPTGTRGDGTSPRYPVIVFIHGESYEWNSGNPYDGSVLASYGGVVVVTINYRLGILGFLNTNTDPYSKSPSNYGLMDQVAALHWIKENIAYFGGDPTNVTVAGHGTGAACVNFLITSSTVPEGVLFQRAILMSGSALSPWALVQEPSRYAAQVAIYANCSPELPQPHLLKCLREKPLEVLMSTPIQAPEFAFAFGPSVDGVAIDTGETPGDMPHHNEFEMGRSPKVEPINTINILNRVLLRKSVVSKLSKYDLMLGVVKAEAYFAFNGEDVQYGIEADRRSKILRTFVRNTYSYHLSEILATIVNEYTDWERPVQHPINIRDETLEALSDAQYVAPVVHTADLHSAEHRNSYLYVFDYQTKFGDYPQRQGCIHGEELPYVFGAPLVGGFMHFGRNYTKAEGLLAETTMIYWSNFIRTGNPNEPPEGDISHGIRQEKNRFKNIEWTAYEAVHKKYLNLDTKPKLKNHYRAHRLSFWLNLVPDLHKPGGDDVPRSHHELIDDDPPPPKLPNLNPRRLPTTETPEVRSSPNFLNISAFATTPSDVNSERVEELGGASTTTHTIEDGFAAYSTALSVTIAIGCSLLILNVLIFAGVYYQRDKSRMNENGQPKKRNENGQMPNNICGDLESSIIGVKSDPATILGHHHSHHQLPPPEFADLPQNNATLPRPPPPPKISKANVNTLSSNPGPENQPLLSSHSIQLINTGTLTKKNTQLNSKQNIQMEELRV